MIEEKESLKESVLKRVVLKKEGKRKLSYFEFKTKKGRNVSSLRTKSCLEFKTKKRRKGNCSILRPKKCLELETEK